MFGNCHKLFSTARFWLKRAAIRGNQLCSDQRLKRLPSLTAMIVRLDHICNLSVCVGGELSNTQSTQIHNSFQSPRFCFNSCSLKQRVMKKKCHFLSSTHLFMWWVLSSQPVLLFRPLQGCIKIRYWIFCLCVSACSGGLGCECMSVCLAYVQHVHVSVLCAPMLPPCFLQLHAYNLPANSLVHL